MSLLDVIFYLFSFFFSIGFLVVSIKKPAFDFIYILSGLSSMAFMFVLKMTL